MDAYLERIGAERPAQADPDDLRELQVRHLLSVPFENLSVRAGEPIPLEEEALFENIVVRRRGGFDCLVNSDRTRALATAWLRQSPVCLPH